MATFSNKKAVIVGAGSGVGEATVLALSALDARVVALGRDMRSLERVRDKASVTLGNPTRRDAQDHTPQPN